MIADGLLRFGQVFLGGGDLLLLLGNVGGQLVDLLHRFENLIGQHAASHLVGRNLVLERLVFAIAGGGVELDLQAFDFFFTAFEQQLLLIAADAGRLVVGLQLGEIFVMAPQVDLAGADLLGTTLLRSFKSLSWR